MQSSNHLLDQKNELIRLVSSFNESLSLNTEGSYFLYEDATNIFLKEFDLKIYDIIIKNNIGSLDKEFIDAVQSGFYKNKNVMGCESEYRSLWKLAINVDHYINSAGNQKEKYSKKIILKLAEFKSEYTAIDKRLDYNYIKKIYLTFHTDLIDLFKNHYPIPPPEFFEAEKIPPFIEKKEKEKINLINEFKFQNQMDLNLEKKIIFFQRHIRAKLRQENEVKRIANLYFKQNENSGEMAIKAIEDANTPYFPKQCGKKLANRIMDCADKVKLYSWVKHLAATANITAILDSCLMGRKNLVNGYLNFRPATLASADIVDGDIDSICLGFENIDKRSNFERTIEIKFNLEKITEGNKNPNIFFKQKDFGYAFDPIQSISIGKGRMYFSHCRSLHRLPINLDSINLQIFHKNGDLAYFAQLPKHHFISYNLPQMHKILTLNFFRFVDQLAPKMAQGIYKRIDLLNDAELIDFLTDIGRKISCTGEFNFSGAYKIDFEAITHFSFYENGFKVGIVEISVLCDELNLGNQTKLNILRKYAPEILKSTRFVEYLNTKLNNDSKIF